MLYFRQTAYHVVLAVILLALVAWRSTSGSYGNCSLCKVPKHKDDEATLEQLKPLCGQRFSVKDDFGEYEYNIGICVGGKVDPLPDQITAGVVQIQINPEPNSERRQTSLGDITKTEVMSGTNWILIEYEGGEKYKTHCAFEERRTHIMITCDQDITEQGKLRYFEENNNKSNDCYYLFELEHSAACVSKSSGGGLSAGSIVCIIFVTILGSYLLFGVLYMRLVQRAKGLHQIPNYEFWRDVGGLQADGCDLICRCSQDRYSSSKPYHGIGDHQIESANDGDDLDEHLLPM